MTYLPESFTEDIKREFPDVRCEYKQIAAGGDIPIFFVNIKTEDALSKTWKEITQFIAVNFQTLLMDEFSLWNVYVFFIVPIDIKDDLKYLIENNTFSSRKIVITGQQDRDTIIKEHVLNSDLNLQTVIDSTEQPFEYDPIIHEFLDEIVAKKRLTTEIEDSLERIIEKIKVQKS